MLGYKVAVGFDRETGPFPVIVTLEIPKDALVVCPIEGMRLDSTIGIESIKKYRTDKAKVVEINPMKPRKNLDWNGKAYSLFHLYNFTWIEKNRLFLGQQFSYEVNEELVCNLDKSVEVSCCEGIHFFETVGDTMLYYNYDNIDWVGYVLNKVKSYWIYYCKDINILAR